MVVFAYLAILWACMVPQSSKSGDGVVEQRRNMAESKAVQATARFSLTDVGTLKSQLLGLHVWFMPDGFVGD